jgi:hypothetical protein
LKTIFLLTVASFSVKLRQTHRSRPGLTLPGSLGNDGAQLLGNLISATVGTLDLFGFPFFHTHNKGKSFTTFLAEKFIGRHALLPLSTAYG